MAVEFEGHASTPASPSMYNEFSNEGSVVVGAGDGDMLGCLAVVGKVVG